MRSAEQFRERPGMSKWTEHLDRLDLGEEHAGRRLIGKTSRSPAQIVDVRGEVEANDVDILICSTAEGDWKSAENTSEAIIPTSAINDQEELCFACGQFNWWTDCYGNTKCGICHPNPSRIL